MIRKILQLKIYVQRFGVDQGGSAERAEVSCRDAYASKNSHNKILGREVEDEIRTALIG